MVVELSSIDAGVECWTFRRGTNNSFTDSAPFLLMASSPSVTAPSHPLRSATPPPSVPSSTCRGTRRMKKLRFPGGAHKSSRVSNNASSYVIGGGASVYI